MISSTDGKACSAASCRLSVKPSNLRVNASSPTEFTSEPASNAPRFGIDEDPVTGAAHAALVPFWARRLCRHEFTAVQASRRPPETDQDLSEMEQIDSSNALKDLETPEHMLLSREIEDTVVRAIEGLPDDLRTAITLRELEGLSYEEIAEAMDCPIGTVRSRIFRAREAIDKLLKPLINQ